MTIDSTGRVDLGLEQHELYDRLPRLLLGPTNPPWNRHIEPIADLLQASSSDSMAGGQPDYWGFPTGSSGWGLIVSLTNRW